MRTLRSSKEIVRKDVDISSWNEVNHIELNKVPLSTQLVFAGVHSDSGYYVELYRSPEDGSRNLRIFHGWGSPYGYFYGDVRNLSSYDFRTMDLEEGVLRLDKNYEIPTFDPDSGILLEPYERGSETRTEPYKVIKVSKSPLELLMYRMMNGLFSKD